jgi:hypothetical protein
MVIKQNPEHDDYQGGDAEWPEIPPQASHGSQATIAAIQNACAGSG